jgi:hypothetical protein
MVYILSKDKGYDNLKEFNIHRIESIAHLKSHSYSKRIAFMNNIKCLLKVKKYKKSENTLEGKIKCTISEICNKYENDIKFINDIATGINKNDKTLINNIIQKKFRNSDVIAQKQLYKALVNNNW